MQRHDAYIYRAVPKVSHPKLIFAVEAEDVSFLVFLFCANSVLISFEARIFNPNYLRANLNPIISTDEAEGCWKLKINIQFLSNYGAET